MAKFEDIYVVFAVFDNESASVGALAGLEHWADTRKDIKLGAVGAMHKEQDDLKVEYVREAGKGVLISGAMGLARSLLGPIALVGDAIGGLANKVFKKSDGGMPDSLSKIGDLMDAGSVTLVMTCAIDEGDAYRVQLETMCGEVTLYEVPKETLEEAAAAIEAAEAQAEAQKQAQKEAQKQAKKEEKENKKERNSG